MTEYSGLGLTGLTLPNSPNAEEALSLLSIPLPPTKNTIEKATDEFLDIGVGERISNPEGLKVNGSRHFGRRKMSIKWSMSQVLFFNYWYTLLGLTPVKVLEIAFSEDSPLVWSSRGVMFTKVGRLAGLLNHECGTLNKYTLLPPCVASKISL